MEGGEREVEGVRGGGVEGVAGRVREDVEIRAHSAQIFRRRLEIKIKVKTTETARAATGAQTKEKFDHVIFACHPHQALAMIGKKNATKKELEILSSFRDDEE